MDLYTPLGVDCSISQWLTSLNPPWCRWRHSVPSVIHSSCSFKLICSSPGFAVLNHHTFPSLFPWHLVPTSTRQRSRSREPVISSSIAGHLCCVRLHVSLDTRLGFNAAYLDFKLSVRQSQPMFLTFCQSQSMFLTSCQSQSMFLTCRLRCLRAADSSPLCDPERQPRTSSSYAADRSLQAFVHVPSKPSVSSPCQRGFRLPALSRWSAHGVPLPLALTRLGYGDVSLRVSRRSLSTLWHPLVHVALPPLPC